VIKINLLPYREERKKANLRRQFVMALIFLGVFMLLILSLHLYISTSISRLETKVEVANGKLTALKKITGNLEKFKKDKEIIKKKIDIIQRLERDRSAPAQLLDELAVRIPIGKAWLSSFKKAESTLTIDGVATDNPTIALFMKSLEESDYIESVDLISSKQINISDTKLMSFVLSCKMAGS
jgi:type IV pilus assembly protein PilN